MGHYGYYNLSKEGREGSRIAFETIGEMVEDFVFIYLGLSTWKYMHTSFSIYYTLGMVLSVLLGRLLSCFILPLFWHVFKGFPLKINELAMIWMGGSIRGSIAFALILSINTEHRDLLKATVLGMVVFTTIIHGAFMPAWGSLIGVRKQVKVEMKDEYQEMPEAPGSPDYLIHKGWRVFDDKYLRRWFIKSDSYASRQKKEEEFRAKHQIPLLQENKKST